MQDQDPMQSGRYENVRVISPEMSYEELVTAPTLPQYVAPPSASAETEWRVPTAPHQNPPVESRTIPAAQFSPLPALAPAPAPAPAPAAPPPAQPAAAWAEQVQAEPIPGSAHAPVEMVRWREDLQVTAAPQERTVGTVRVRKYVTVEDFTGTIPIEYETVQVIREPVTAQEAALLAPADIAELTQEVELHTQEALVTRRMVPIERVRLQISRVTGEATINDTLRSEHFEVDEPSAPPNLQEAVRRVDAPYDGRIDHGQQRTQTQTTQAQGARAEGIKRRFGWRG